MVLLKYSGLEPKSSHLDFKRAHKCIVKATINPRDHLGPKNAGNYIQRRTLIKCLKPATLAYNIHQG